MSRRAVAAAIAIAGFVAGLFPIFDGDIFWHLAAGRWIVEHGAVPRLDPFRFGAERLPWVDHEWLFQVVAFGLERAVGLDGLIVVRAAALAGFALLIFFVCRRARIGDGLAGLVALGALLGVRPRFLDRPEIVTLFAVVLLLLLLEEEEEEKRIHRGKRPSSDVVFAGSQRSLPALLVPFGLVVVWVNFHGEAMLAPVLAGLFLLGAAVEERAAGRGPGWGRRREIVAVPALLAAALLVNPYGWRIVEVPLGIRAALADLAATNPEWQSAFQAPQPYLFGGMAAVAALAVAARRERGRWPAPEWGLPALALAVVALGAVRHQALFYAAAAPFAARCLGALGAVRTASASRLRQLAALGVAASLLAALWCAFPPAAGPLRPRHGGLRLGWGIAEGRFPRRLTERLAAHPEVGSLYNELLHGGYLLWRLHPPRQVFLDGRMELEPMLLRELVAARRSASSWGDLLRRRGASGALVRYENRVVPVLEPAPGGNTRRVDERTPNALLFPGDRWDLVDWDDEAMLFLARDEHAWPSAPYRHVQPEDPAWTLRRAASDAVFRAGARAELERKLAEQPECRRARKLLEALGGMDSHGSREAAPQ